jgi:hypothetical protein
MTIAFEAGTTPVADDPVPASDPPSVGRRLSLTQGVPSMKTAHLAMMAAAETAADASATFSVLVRRFILESFLLSGAAAIVPVVVLLTMTRPWIEAIALQYYSSGEDESPCYLALLNVTVAPIKGHYAARYFLPPPGPNFVNHLLEVLQIGVAGSFSTLVKALLMFRPPASGVVAATAVAACSLVAFLHFFLAKRELDHESGESTSAAGVQELCVILVFVLGFPSVGVAAAASAGGLRKRHLALVFGLFLGSNFVEFVFYEVLSGALLPYFFLPTTTALGHFLARGPILFAIFTILMEILWQFTFLAVHHLGVETRNSHILLTACVVVVPMFARLMQGSAESAGSSAFYETISTGCELVAVHSLLKGRTPWWVPTCDRAHLRPSAPATERTRPHTCSAAHALGRTCARPQVMWLGAHPYFPTRFARSRYDTTLWCRWLWRTLWCGNRYKVEPERTPEEREHRQILFKERREFCASAVIMMSIGEAASIISTSAYFSLLNVNPSSAGSERIPTAQTLTSLVIQLFGEVFLSDIIVTYMSHANKKIYCIDLAVEWDAVKKSKSVSGGIARTRSRAN